mgnify:CR=1 FL=1
MRVAIYTLGCKVNQYETQAMEQELQRRGHTLVDFESPADAYIINTCSVTAVSDKKSRQMIRRAKSRNPQAVVAACGCYVQTHTPEAQELGIDLIGGTGDRMEFLTLLEQAAEDHRSRVAVDEALRRRNFEVLPAGGMAARTRAMLKVEDGCVNFCTYCIIPYARGPVRSLPLEEAVRQTEQLRREGYREVVFTGIEISSWGQDFKDGRSLIDLLEAVSQAAGEMRLRLGSLEPRTVTEDFCRRAARLPNLCPQFHLSMQSGCDATLRRMNRPVPPVRDSAAAVLSPARHHHGSDLRFPRRDGGGVLPDAGFPAPLRLCPDAHLPLLHPPRHQGGGDGAGPRPGEGGACRPCGGGGGGAAPCLSAGLRRPDLSRAFRAAQGRLRRRSCPQLYAGGGADTGGLP